MWHFNTLLKKIVKLCMSVLVIFVQSSTMDNWTLFIQLALLKSQMQYQVFRSISILFDTLILASLARTEATEKGEGEGRGEGWWVGGASSVGPNMHGIQLQNRKVGGKEVPGLRAACQTVGHNVLHVHCTIGEGITLRVVIEKRGPHSFPFSSLCLWLDRQEKIMH